MQLTLFCFPRWHPVQAQHLCSLVTMFFLLQLGGCANIRNATMPDAENLLSGAGSLMAKRSSDREGAGIDGFGGSDYSTDAFEQLDLDDLRQKYNLRPEAITGDLDSSFLAYRRNELQDHIIAASNQRCGTYLRTVVSSQAQTKTLWGAVATLLSGAASVATPTSAARALAAGSTVSNGILRTYNEAYFQNLALTVIAAGITRQRQAVMERILKDRHAGLIHYSVNRAIADALNYHAACNMVTGLEVAAATVKGLENDALVGRPEQAANREFAAGESSSTFENRARIVWMDVTSAIADVNAALSAKAKSAGSGEKVPTLIWSQLEAVRKLQPICSAKLAEHVSGELSKQVTLAANGKTKQTEDQHTLKLMVTAQVNARLLVLALENIEREIIEALTSLGESVKKKEVKTGLLDELRQLSNKSDSIASFELLQAHCK